MTIASRTPEGTPNCCPLCGNTVRVEPSLPFGDAPCPSCGTLLWFVASDTSPRFFDPEVPGLRELVANQLGISPDALRERQLHELGINSLDLVELVMELEDQR